MARWRRHAPAVALYAVLTVVALWPAVRHFTTRPLIGSTDSSYYYWSWWHLPRALASGEGVLRTTDLMYPVGVDLSASNMAPAVAAVSSPIRALFGPEAQVNAVQLLATFTAALAAYALALRVCRRRSVATLAGAAFAFTPFRFVHLGEHLNLVATAIVPVCVLAALRFVELPSTKRAVTLGAMLAVAVLIEPQLAWIAMVGVLVVFWPQRRIVGAGWRSLTLGALVAAILAAPVVVPLARSILAGEAGRPEAAEALPSVSSSPFSWVVSARHPLYGRLGEVELLSSSLEGLAAPGLLLIGLAIAGRRRRPASSRPWAALAVVGVVLSLGPYLVIGGRYLPLPLPFRALNSIPGLNFMRVPGRFALLGVLGLCVLASVGLTDLLQRHPRRQRVLLLGAALITAVELLPGPIRSRPGGAPAPYSAIAADPGDGAVLELPLQWSTGQRLVGYEQLNVTLYMAWATVHGKPFVGGSVARFSDARLERLLAIPVYRQILGLQGDGALGDPPRFTAADLGELGIGYVVYHRDVPIRQARAYFDSLDMPVLADDGTVLVWKVPSR